MEKIQILKSVEETYAFAREFAATLKAGDMLALHGDLGSGKTTFIKGLAKAYGMASSQSVTSPTFALMNIYETTPVIYHFDLYRLDSVKELENIGFEEFLNNAEVITCVEWAEKAGDLIPAYAHHLSFEVIDPETRKATVN